MMERRKPKTCCTCVEEPESRDACMCGCGYLNGIGPILGAQMLMFMGFLFSFAALGDCSFIELDTRLFFPNDFGGGDLPTEITQTRFVGFLTWQKLDGLCYWYDAGSDPEDQLQTYLDLLGTDWQIPRILGGCAATLSLYAFCYLLSFICSSQVRGVRYFTMFFISVALTIFQGLTFLTFRSSFCNEQGCTFSRSAAFSVAAMACMVLSGLCFLWTKDYPGDRWAGGVAKVAPSAIGETADVEQAKISPIQEDPLEAEHDEHEDEYVEEEEIEESEGDESRQQQEDHVDDSDASEEIETEAARNGDELDDRHSTDAIEESYHGDEGLEVERVETGTDHVIESIHGQ